MAAARRPRAATEARRVRILDATEEIILERGYAAVSSRSVAAGAGIQAPHVHYYFATIDDLFVAVLHRRADGNVERMAAALESAEPLRAWWDLASDQRGTALMVELLAAANHRPALRAEMAAMAKRVRSFQVDRLATLLDEYGIDQERYPPVLIAAAVQGLAFSVVSDQAAGYDTRPGDAADAVAGLLRELEDRRSGGAPA